MSVINSPCQILDIRTTTTAEMQTTYSAMGLDIWELAAVACNWLTVSYYLYSNIRLSLHDGSLLPLSELLQSCWQLVDLFFIARK